MRAEITGTQPIGNNTGTATYYNLIKDDEVVQYHCTKYDSGDIHLSGDTGARAKGVRAGTYGGKYMFNVKPQFLDEVMFMMNECGIPRQGGSKKSRRNRKRRFRTRKSSHKKLALSSAD